MAIIIVEIEYQSGLMRDLKWIWRILRKLGLRALGTGIFPVLVAVNYLYQQYQMSRELQHTLPEWRGAVPGGGVSVTLQGGSRHPHIADLRPRVSGNQPAVPAVQCQHTTQVGYRSVKRTGQFLLCVFAGRGNNSKQFVPSPGWRWRP